MRSLALIATCSSLAFLPAFVLGAGPAAAPDNPPKPGVNLALGRPYTLDPKPNYALCTDPGDVTQLTDGAHSSGHFWTQAGTVGWQNVPMAQITIDLGGVRAIQGASFHTAAGTASVSWPASITILVSDDGRNFHEAGDLVSLSAAHGLPKPEGYAAHRFWTDQLATHGRFVRVIPAGGPYLFVDEIEVYQGPDALLEKPFAGQPITDTKAFFRRQQVRASVLRRIVGDAQILRAALGDRKEWEAELSAIVAEAARNTQQEPDTFKAVLPLNDLHARLFRVQAALWKAQGAGPLTAWQSPLWDPMSPIAPLPQSPAPPRLEVALMRGEYRSSAFNLSNATDRALTLRVRLEGIPDGCVTVHEVAWTDTKRGVPAAAALPEARREGGDFLVSAPSGLTRQVWLTFHPPANVKPGRHEGRILVSGDGLPPITAPAAMRVSALRFPEAPTLSLGGFDYTDADSYSGMKHSNRDALIAHLRARFVDTPWATGAVMPNPPDFQRLDAWLDRWPGARHLRVFNSVGGAFAGHRMGTPEFDKAVGAWITAYVTHLKARGIAPSRLGLLLVDEPHRPEQNEVIVAWAKAVRAAEPEVLIWEDPTFRDATQAAPIFPVSDVLCPNRPMWIERGPEFHQVYRDQRAAGKTLNFYSCSGPVRSLDPYAYHRLQAWACWREGATAMFYWAFGDNGSGSDWNEYAAPGTSFSPAFIAPEGVTAAKHMEAIREGVEDHEYLVMLRDRIAAIERSGKPHDRLAAARNTLATAADAVLDAPGAEKLGWSDPKDRTVADRIRVGLLDALESLQE